VIRNITDQTTQDIYDGVNSRQARKLPRELHSRAQRLLDRLNAAPNLEMMRVPPSNHMEKLRGDLKGFWSLRVNKQWRIIFRWESREAVDVRIIDYHA
jgi:proteic killer suppression protein